MIALCRILWPIFYAYNLCVCSKYRQVLLILCGLFSCTTVGFDHASLKQYDIIDILF